MTEPHAVTRTSFLPALASTLTPLTGLRARLLPHRLALAVLAAHLLLSLIYSVVIPPWEAHDEWAHYKYVEYVARHWALPPAGTRLTTEYRYDEATQPPLYYLLAALPVALVDTSDGLRPVVNPYATTGTGEGGVNMAVHDPLLEGWPWQGTILALHLARWASVVMGTLGLLATYALARLLLVAAWPAARRSPEETHPSHFVGEGFPVLALAIHAFSLQWLFVNSVVTNDVLIAALAGIVLYLGMRLVLRSAGIGNVLGLGISSGLALLTKYTALALLPVALLAVTVASVRTLRHQRAKLWRMAAAMLGFTLVLAAVAGWFFWRNWQLYGRLASRDPYLEANFWDRLSRPASLVQGLPWHNVAPALRYGFRTFWASFGWGNVEAASWVYWLWGLLCLLGLAGFLTWLSSQRSRKAVLAGGFLLLQIVLSVALPLYRALLHETTFLRGRYLLPMLPAVAVILALGLLVWLRPGQQQVVAAVLATGLGLTALITPFAWIAPVYSRPAALGEQAEALPYPLHGRFTSAGGDLVEITSYDLWPRGQSAAEAEVTPGQGLAVTLEWRVLRRAEHNYTVGLHLLGRDNRPLGGVNRYPGLGNRATSIWRPGDRWRETFWLKVDDGQGLPSIGRLALTLFRADGNGEYLPAVAADGTPLGDTIYFGRVRVGPVPTSTVGLSPPTIAFGDPTWPDLALTDWRLDGELQAGTTITVTLTWQALAAGQADLTTFVQVLDNANRWVAGRDGPPDPQYPTGLWLPGDTVTRQFVVALPADLPTDAYRLLVGLYDPTTGQRLPAYVEGQRQADDAVQLYP